MAYKLVDKDDNPIKHEDKEVFGLDSVGVVKSVNMDRRTLTMIATDESKDRDGDIILAKGWDFTNYKKNPVFLWAHNYTSVPLAAAIRIVRRRIESNPTEMTHKFPTEGLNPFADMILELFNQKIINAGSVGFIPFKWEDMPRDKNDPDKYIRGRKFVKQELLEHSAVPVPSNPNAIQDAIKSMNQPDTVKELVFNSIAGKSTYGHTNKQKADINSEMDEIKANGVEVEEEIFQVQVPKDINFEADEMIELGEKPYKNEHSCRLEDDKQFDKFARKNCEQKHDDKCIDVIYGIKDNKSKIQSLRYKTDVWTESAAKKHCKEKEGLFEPAAKEAKEKYNCECISCGHKLKSDKHCKDIKCPKCGSEMRREERPGPGSRELDTNSIEIDINEAIDVINDAYEAGYPIDGWIKTGAVLSGKDKVSLEKAGELIQNVLETAKSIERQNPLEHAQDNELNAKGGVIESILELEEGKKVDKADNLRELTKQLKIIVTAISKI